VVIAHPLDASGTELCGAPTVEATVQQHLSATSGDVPGTLNLVGGETGPGRLTVSIGGTAGDAMLDVVDPSSASTVDVHVIGTTAAPFLRFAAKDAGGRELVGLRFRLEVLMPGNVSLLDDNNTESTSLETERAGVWLKQNTSTARSQVRLTALGTSLDPQLLELTLQP
jgi:hypothetical protein